VLNTAKKEKVKRSALKLIVVFILLFPCIVEAQKEKVKNLQKYDERPLHFGFSLGINRSNFIITPIKNLASLDTVLSVLPSAQPGFNIAIITDLKIYDYLSLRFLPALSFQSRILNYSIVNKVKKDTVSFSKSVESTVIELPLNIKLRSERVNNIALYLVAGAKYGYDLASQKDAKLKDDLAKVIVKLSRHDISTEAGIGADYYFPYFKFSTEIKASWGIKNLLVKDTDVFSNSLDKLRSQVILISLHFEG
jgi:hypothetical protein